MAEGQQPEEENAYEKRRRLTIEANRARLRALGIPGLVAALNPTAQRDSKRPLKPKRTLDRAAVPEAARRKSRRVQGQTAPPEDDELGTFVVNGDCPYCGKVLQQNHKVHLGRCKRSGRPRRDMTAEADGAQPEDEHGEEDEEELQQLALDEEAERLKRQDDKLQDLNLDGLIDFDKDHARFVVLGSTKNYYKVELRTDKQSCECMDHRLRRHACKHISLVLTQLGIVNEPATWHKAVKDKLVEFGRVPADMAT